MRKIASLAVLGLMLLAPQAAMADPINSDAPDIATGTFAVPPRIYQLEQNVQVNFAAGVPTFNFPSLHRIGLVDTLELRLESPLVDVSTAGALTPNNYDVALKWNMEKLGLPDWLPPLALLGGGSLDGASKAITPAASLLTDIALPLDVGLNANAGVVVPAGAPAMTYALSFARDISGPLQAYAEVAGSVGSAGAQTGVDGGLMMFVGEDSKIMAAVYTDVAKPFDEWYVTTNFSHRFGSY